MKRWTGSLALCAALASLAASKAGDDLETVRGDLARLVEKGSPSSEAVRALADRCFALIGDASDRAAYFSAMTLLSDLYHAAPSDEAPSLQERALELLARQPVDSVRWASFVDEGFAPRLDLTPQARWRDEITAYDRLLDRLRAETKDEGTAIELTYAKAALRVRLERQASWLTAADRRQAIELLQGLVRSAGDRPCPGERPGEGLTVGERSRRDADELERLHFGALAPATHGSDLTGRAIDLADFRGHVVVLDFWTTFCGPCLAMVPSTHSLLQRLEGSPVTFLGINGDQQREKGLATAHRLGMTWQSFWDGPLGVSGPIVSAWDVRSWPTMFVLDGGGRIRYKFFGREAAEKGLDAAIAALLQEPPAAPGGAAGSPAAGTRAD